MKIGMTIMLAVIVGLLSQFSFYVFLSIIAVYYLYFTSKT